MMPAAPVYRGRGAHRCGCGGALVLDDPAIDRRNGGDRRRVLVRRWPEWRGGPERREGPPAADS
jgi:hypothetical protein